MDVFIIEKVIIQLLYFCLFILIISSACMVIYTKNPVYSIFFLIIVFCLCACLLILLNVEFLGIIFLVIYVGAIAVLFLFVIMMLNIRLVELEQLYIRYIPIGLIFVSMLFCIVSYIMYNMGFFEDYTWGLFLWLQEYNADMNLIILGVILYTYYMIEFIIAGIILLVAMIGTIVITLNHKKNVKRQELFKQLSREYTLNKK